MIFCLFFKSMLEQQWMCRTPFCSSFSVILCRLSNKDYCLSWAPFARSKPNIALAKATYLYWPHQTSCGESMLQVQQKSNNTVFLCSRMSTPLLETEVNRQGQASMAYSVLTTSFEAHGVESRLQLTLKAVHTLWFFKIQIICLWTQ